MKLLVSDFNFHSTADEVAAGMDLSDKTAIVTGGASGIGIETARTLAKCGAAVTLAVRDLDAGWKAAADIVATTGNKNIRIEKLDLSNIASVQMFTRAWQGPLNILVNNAGVMAIQDHQKTAEGWEMQFATNHIGHFALSMGLHEALTITGDARIVMVSSAGHMLSPVIFDDLHYAFRAYDPWLAYGQSKTANILFAVGAAARWEKDGITANALNPGAIATNLQRHIGGVLRMPPEMQKTPQQGAATSVFLATSPALKGISGRYFEDVSEAPVVTSRPDDYHGVAAYALDPENADRLWSMSLDLLKM